MISFDNVSFAYNGGSHAGVSDISFHISPGETVLLCGDSGCGKTTVTRLINGLAPHYFDGELSGGVQVGGMDVPTSDLAKVSRMVGSVFQNPKSQFFTLDVTGELAFACENFEMPPNEIHERISATAADFHMEHLLGRGITRMSGGQKQKVACASVSTAGPEVMVLDEPSSNLDARAIADLRRIVALWKSQGKTVVIAEHRLYWLDGLIDRALYLRAGRVEREMTGHELGSLGFEEREAMGLRPVTATQITQASRAGFPAGCPNGYSTGSSDGSPDGASVGASADHPCDAAPHDSTGLHHDCEPIDSARPGIYEIKDMQYTYRHTKSPALHVPRTLLREGSVTAITGFNGAGKSTFARCLQGLDKQCKGIVTSPSGDVLDRKARLESCFTVLQDVNCELFTESVLDEVLLAQPHENKPAAMEILARLDLAELSDRHPLSLSGGQKQRVAIAAALASERPIIIFDEPTSGLDMGHMRQVAGLIRDLAAHRRTIVVITHDPEFTLAACDYNISIADGMVTDSYVLDKDGACRLANSLISDTRR